MEADMSDEIPKLEEVPQEEMMQRDMEVEYDQNDEFENFENFNKNETSDFSINQQIENKNIEDLANLNIGKDEFGEKSDKIKNTNLEIDEWDENESKQNVETKNTNSSNKNENKFEYKNKSIPQKDEWDENESFQKVESKTIQQNRNNYNENKYSTNQKDEWDETESANKIESKPCYNRNQSENKYQTNKSQNDEWNENESYKKTENKNQSYRNNSENRFMNKYNESYDNTKKTEYKSSNSYNRNDRNYQNKNRNFQNDEWNEDSGSKRIDSRTTNYNNRNDYNYNKDYKSEKNDDWNENKNSDRSRSNNYDRNYDKTSSSYKNDEKQSYQRNEGSRTSGTNYDKPKKQFNDNKNADIEMIDQEDTKPPVYHPQMPSDDTRDIFKQHITEGIDFAKYKNVKVKVSGGDEKQRYIQSFDEPKIQSNIFDNIKHSGYRVPTPIQKFCIPMIIDAKYDIMACAQTGSGKTAAFLIPIFNNILRDNLLTNTTIAEPTLLVVAPTRELANQIWMDMRRFSYGTNIKPAVIYGGISGKFINSLIRNGCDALVATPGRLLDLTTRGLISLKKVEYLVLDEGDRLLDMGFFPDIKKIVFERGMGDKSTRRCYMFSATYPQEVRELAREVLSPNYYFLTVGMVGSAADSIMQKFYLVDPWDKREKLCQIIETFKNLRTLVFVETKKSADFLTTFLCQQNIKATSIHGDRFQEQREDALRTFRLGEHSILVATSVAARGLDIKGVECVVNFDLPKTIDEYIHRIGRTGRLGNKGCAVSFFTPGKDEPLSSLIVDVLKNVNQEIPEFLQQYDYAPTGMTKNLAERDDREIRTRTHKVQNRSNFLGNQNDNKKTPSYVDNNEEAWD